MVLNYEQWSGLNSNIKPKTGMKDTKYRWLDKTVPYQFSDEIG